MTLLLPKGTDPDQEIWLDPDNGGLFRSARGRGQIGSLQRLECSVCGIILSQASRGGEEHADHRGLACGTAHQGTDVGCALLAGASPEGFWRNEGGRRDSVQCAEMELAGAINRKR